MAYYSALEWNMLSSCEKVWRNLKCILLSEKKKPVWKVTFGIIGICYVTFWKRQNIEKVKRSGVARDSGEGKGCVSGTQSICRVMKLFCMEYEWSGNLKLLLFYNFISLVLAVPSSSPCGLVSHCGEWGPLSSCSAGTSCSAFSCRRAQALRHPGFSRCALWAQ